MNKIREYLVKKCRSLKLNSANPYVEEFTVFIIVKIDSLNELSISIPLIDNRLVKNNKEIIKISIDRKYL